MSEPSSAKLLLHPVRLRIVQAFLGGRELTTAALRAELADVPTASLYRQVGVLTEAGVLIVSAERRVRGAVERTYVLRTAAAVVSPQELASMSPADHRAAFTAFVSGLLADFDRYLAAGPPDLLADGVGYRQAALWLSDDEFAGMAMELQAVVLKRIANEPAAGRRRRLLSTILVPGDPAYEESQPGAAGSS